MSEEKTQRVEKKSGRHYTNPRKSNPANYLIPPALRVLEMMFPRRDTGPSVTTVLQVLNKPALIAWASREERKLVAMVAANLYTRLPQLVEGTATPDQFYTLLVEEAGKPANRRLLEKASSVGTQVHARIEWEFKGELGLPRDLEPPVLTSPQAERSFTRWLEWRAQVKLKLLSTEQKIYSSMFGYGGTLDFLAEVWLPQSEATAMVGKLVEVNDEGLAKVTVVGDFKTGKSIYAESFLQNVAYRMAVQEMGIHTDGGIIVRLPKYEDDPEFDAQPVPNDPTLAPTFLALLVVFQWWSREHNTKGKKPTTPQDKGGSQNTSTVIG